MLWCVTPTTYIGHQQHCLNEGGYLVCDNVPLGFYQCDMKAECDSMTIQSLLPFPSCVPPLVVQEFLPLIKMMTLRQTPMKVNINPSSIYAPEVCGLVRRRNYVLENLKKKKLLVALEIQMCLVYLPSLPTEVFYNCNKLFLDSTSSSCTPLCALKSFSKMFFPSSDNKWCTESCKNVRRPDSNHICGDLWI